MINESHNDPKNQPKEDADEDNQQGHNNPDDDQNQFRFSDGKGTLVKNLSEITTGKIEQDMVHDPLFIKMSSKFEEGGANGMLMCNLPQNKNLKMMLDTNEGDDEDYFTQLENLKNNPFIGNSQSKNRPQVRLMHETIYSRKDLETDLFRNFKAAVSDCKLFDEITWFRNEYCKDDQNDELVRLQDLEATPTNQTQMNITLLDEVNANLFEDND